MYFDNASRPIRYPTSVLNSITYYANAQKNLYILVHVNGISRRTRNKIYNTQIVFDRTATSNFAECTFL